MVTDHLGDYQRSLFVGALLHIILITQHCTYIANCVHVFYHLKCDDLAQNAQNAHKGHHK